MGRTEFLTWNRLRGEPWLVEQKQKQQQQQQLPRERNGALRTARIGAPQKCLTLPTLLETRFINNQRVSASSRARCVTQSVQPPTYCQSRKKCPAARLSCCFPAPTAANK